ncbi:TylF/MycF family methyltransferase [Occallatibacter riparius]|uniref:TylF/MycF family methyltransferase n=1 Tax=Occallatibacter riparius TaxID=1002689 RepID=A0A9J7BX06_9BACT|nr:TylF/MycF family methyltransferase [Occallatibacter riparius]UWZ86378.1 TylF/MycF family methyltransferase [Occallatibacter riparius]
MGLGIRTWLERRGILLLRKSDYHADGVAVRGKNLSALSESAFDHAYHESIRLNRAGWPNGVPDVRWRAHVCCWAARNALLLEGDFVECGVNTGLLSLTVGHFLNFATLNRTFWLFDTFEGIPVERVSAEERAHAAELNAVSYFDCYDVARSNFAPFPNARLVRGVLPDSLATAQIERIAYLSIDLNNAAPEIASIERLWPKLSPGAIVVLDDYAFTDYETQHRAWNDFAASKNRMILTVPTGQGILIKADS